VVEAKTPKRSDTASPWKIGSRRITAAPTIAAAAVSTIGLNLTAPASIMESFSGAPSRFFIRMKSTRMMEFLTTIPASAMKPIIEVAVKYVVFPSICVISQ
jgi:hypothetical protein